MGERLCEAEQLLKLWGRAIIDSEVYRLAYDDMSSQEKLNHVRGGERSDDPNKKELAIGAFMSERLSKLEWRVSALIWCPQSIYTKGERLAMIDSAYSWKRGKVERFEDYLIERVALELV